MAQKVAFVFTLPQIEALVKALEQCGINSGSSRIMIEHFREPSLVTAAIIARRILRGKGQKATGHSEEVGISETSAIDELRQANKDIKEEMLSMRVNRKDLLESLNSILIAIENGHSELAARKIKDAISDVEYGFH